MREEIRISIQDGHFRSADPKGHGSSGQIKTKAGSLFFARKVSVSLNGEEKILNKGSLINFLNEILRQENKELLKKDRFFGLITGASKTKIQKIFNEIYNVKEPSEIELLYSGVTQDFQKKQVNEDVLNEAKKKISRQFSAHK